MIFLALQKQVNILTEKVQDVPARPTKVHTNPMDVIINMPIHLTGSFSRKLRLEITVRPSPAFLYHKKIDGNDVIR